MNPYLAAELGAARARDLQAEAAQYRRAALAKHSRPSRLPRLLHRQPNDGAMICQPACC